MPAPLLSAVVLVAFWPSLGNGFVNWDDRPNFLDNTGYRGLGPNQIWWAVTSYHLGVYQPLAWLLLSAQYSVCGLDPRAYHLTSLAFYAADIVVLYGLAVALIARAMPEQLAGYPRAIHAGAGLAVAFFAVHPLRVEVVAWASCQPYLPCAFFAMLSVVAYLRAHPEGCSSRLGWSVASFLLLGAALLCKAAAAPLPLVLLILDVYPLRRLGMARSSAGPAARVWLEKVPFFAMGLTFMAVAVQARREGGALTDLGQNGAAPRLLQASCGAWFYLAKTVLPSEITAYYPLPQRLTFSEPQFALSALLVVIVTSGLALSRRRTPGLLAAWAAYLVMLAPSSGLVRAGDQIAADRYSFIPMISLVIALGAGLSRFLKTIFDRRTLVDRISSPGACSRPLAAGIAVMAVGMVLALIPSTRFQCRTWRDSETLWTHALSQGSGRSVIVRYNLGSALADLGRVDEALEQYREVLRIEPEQAETHFTLGVLLADRGRFDEAATHYTRALHARPRHAGVHAHLGHALARLGRMDEAAVHLNEALSLDPSDAITHSKLANIYLMKGKLNLAFINYHDAIRINPQLAEPHFNMGLILAAQDDPEGAILHYQEALRLRPGWPMAANNLAWVLSTAKDSKIRDAAMAIRVAEQLCQNTGGTQPIALNTLAAAYAAAGRYKDAVTTARRAVVHAEESDDIELARRIRELLALYEIGRPIHERP